MFTTFTKLEEMLKKRFMETCSLTLAKLIEGIFRPDDTSGHISFAQRTYFTCEASIFHQPKAGIFHTRRVYIFYPKGIRPSSLRMTGGLACPP